MYSHRLRGKVRRAQKEVETGTQRLRQKLITQLESMFDLAEQSARNAKTPKQREGFMRIAGYIAQVLNSLSRSFDEALINEELDRLEKMIDETIAKDKDKGTAATVQGPSGS